MNVERLIETLKDMADKHGNDINPTVLVQAVLVQALKEALPDDQAKAVLDTPPLKSTIDQRKPPAGVNPFVADDIRRNIRCDIRYRCEGEADLQRVREILYTDGLLSSSGRITLYGKLTKPLQAPAFDDDGRCLHANHLHDGDYWLCLDCGYEQTSDENGVCRSRIDKF